MERPNAKVELQLTVTVDYQGPPRDSGLVARASRLATGGASLLSNGREGLHLVGPGRRYSRGRERERGIERDIGREGQRGRKREM